MVISVWAVFHDEPHETPRLLALFENQRDADYFAGDARDSGDFYDDPIRVMEWKVQ